jgi:hypothetical protein
MSSRVYGSVGFSEVFSVKCAEEKERALKGLRLLLSLTYPPEVAYGYDEAVAKYQEETDGLSAISTEEIFRLNVPASRRFEFERLGFKIYPVAA